MDGRENESINEVVPVTGHPVCTAIQRVAALMQANPGLWTYGTHLRCTRRHGVEISMHGNRYADITALTAGLGITADPVEVREIEHDDKVRVFFVSWHNGATANDGGIEIVWFTSRDNASAALGPDLSALIQS